VHERISLAAHAAAVAALLKFPIVAVADVVAVCLVIKTVVDIVVMSVHLTSHPFEAPGKAITPLVAVPPVPTLIVKTTDPLLCAIDGEVPNPEEIVGGV